MTYSIVGFDPETGALGGAVQSKFPGVGNLVLHVRAGIGVIVTQAFSNPEHPDRGFPLLSLGASPEEVVSILLRGDAVRDDRQVAVLASDGAVGLYTGANVETWDGAARGVAGAHCAAIGNSLTADRVVDAMCGCFAETRGELGLRLIAALAAGEEAGGELRGQQSAAVRTARPGGGYGGWGLEVDIPVYDHPAPTAELERCYALHRLSYFPSDPANVVEIGAALREELGGILCDLGYLERVPASWGRAEIEAMARFMGVENYDNRIRDDARIDLEVVADIRRRRDRDLLVRRSRA